MSQPAAATPERVLLLHGLWMHAPAMLWLARQLRAVGFDAHTLGYYSVMEPTERAVIRIRDSLLATPGTHVVAHSLGGLLALRAMHALPPDTVGRVVCLGTPLAGSAAAEGVCRRVPGGARMIGKHTDLLLAGAGTLPPGVQVGEIAGSKPVGLGGFFAGFDDVHDGTVALSETRADGLADHITVAASHSGLVVSAQAVRQVVAFLRSGRFQHPEQDSA